MKTGIIIIARLQSTRLRRKHLLKVKRYSILYYLIRRIQKEFEKEMQAKEIELIISTSKIPGNEDFKIFKKYGVRIFYGSNDNIPLRLLQTTEDSSLDNVVSIDGDDILCSVKGMRTLLQELQKGTEYAQTVGLPFGMNSSAYTKEFLRLSLQSHGNEILETNWGRIFDKNKAVQINIENFPQDDRMRFTLDYQEDFELFKSIILNMGDSIITAKDKEIVDLVKKEKLFKYNENKVKEYWDNYRRLVKKERSEQIN